MYLIGAAATGLFGFLYFGMLDTVDMPSAVFIAIVLSLIPHDMMYGPQAALIAEAFTPRLRYSGVVAGLPACLDHRRRSRAAHRDRTVRRLSHRLRDRDLHCRLRGDQPDLDGADAGLHGAGYFGGGRRRKEAGGITTSACLGRPP